MIVVWNCIGGATYGFSDLNAYKEFAKSTQDKGRDCWYDYVYDVGGGGETSYDNLVYMRDFNESIS